MVFQGLNRADQRSRFADGSLRGKQGQAAASTSPLGRTETMGGETIPNYKYISCDDHVLEPPETYIKRVPVRFKEIAPHIENIDGADVWVAEGTPIQDAQIPAAPGVGRSRCSNLTYDNIPPGVWKAEDRLRDYDKAKVYAAALFPDMLPGFSGNPFSFFKDIELRRLCVRAYNDMLTEEFYAVNPKRFIPIGIITVWSAMECVEEVKRIANLGHKGILWGGLSDIFGYPWMGDRYWYPLWEAVQEIGMVLCLHQQSVAVERIKVEMGKTPENMRRAIHS